MSESALRLEDREAATDIQEALLCYSRAVRHKEWGPMELGERDPDVSVWADRLQTDLAALKFASDDDEIGRLINLDSDRASARVARITESSPTNPDGLNYLMLGTVTVSVIGLGLFVNIKGDRFIHIAILAVLTVILSGTLYMINDLDEPFSGLNKLKATDMEHSEEILLKQLPSEDDHRLCDDQGDAA